LPVQSFPPVFCFPFSFSSGSLTAQTYYVNDAFNPGDHYTTAAGNDANNGTPNAPFRTLQHAISVAIGAVQFM